ncbi:hypothetical protein BaRGS_00022946 [Batillaria attramentaria]|uniref:Uncharacterized protein n=1 Tax=Batillaria attramentaria TaxID=370345 RepID=A0ABD0KFJ8_9CAEN
MKRTTSLARRPGKKKKPRRKGLCVVLRANSCCEVVKSYCQDILTEFGVARSGQGWYLMETETRRRLLVCLCVSDWSVTLTPIGCLALEEER